MRTVKVLLLATAVIIITVAGPGRAENLYALQGKVTLSNGTPVNGAAIYINDVYQGTTLNSSIHCQGDYEGDGCYKIEGDAPGLNLCSSSNRIVIRKQINGNWYYACQDNVWIWDGYCNPCGRQDIVITYPGTDCFESKGGK